MWSACIFVNKSKTNYLPLNAQIFISHFSFLISYWVNISFISKNCSNTNFYSHFTPKNSIYFDTLINLLILDTLIFSFFSLFCSVGFSILIFFFLSLHLSNPYRMSFGLIFIYFYSFLTFVFHN